MSQLIVTANKLNKRRAIPAQLPDAANIAGVVFKGFEFQAEEVAATDIPNKALGSWYKDRDGYYYWGGAVAVEAMPVVVPSPTPVIHKPLLDAPAPFSADLLPIPQKICVKVAQWLEQHFANQFAAAVKDTVFEKELLYAIACQETAIYWYQWISEHTPEEILSYCVFDASGDANGDRSAFPKNTPAFIARYGQEKANILIAEGNKVRALRHYGPKPWVYAGYGIFQYDIQFVQDDPAFFFEKRWYFIEDCLSRVMKELKKSLAAHGNNMFAAVKGYNGSGSKAQQYALNVSQFYTWIKAVTV